jgi:hypothetical protein
MPRLASRIKNYEYSLHPDLFSRTFYHGVAAILGIISQHLQSLGVQAGRCANLLAVDSGAQLLAALNAIARYSSTLWLSNYRKLSKSWTGENLRTHILFPSAIRL